MQSVTLLICICMMVLGVDSPLNCFEGSQLPVRPKTIFKENAFEKKKIYDGRTREAKKFVEPMLARREAKKTVETIFWRS